MLCCRAFEFTTRLTFFVSLIVLSHSRIYSQLPPEPRTLSGNVYHAGGNQPAENVSVELHSTEGSIIALIPTSSTGWFEFRGLPRGVYVIQINLSGFEPVSFSVDLYFSSSRGNVIYLNPRADSSPNQPSGHTVSAHELSMPKQARALMASGKKKLYTDKDPEAGLKDFQQAVSAAPGYYEACYQIAMADVTLGRKENAAQAFRKAIELSRDTYGEADIGLGTIMVDDADFSGGEKAIRRGIELSPTLWLGHYELGRVLLSENRIGDAEKAALQARSLAPNTPIVYRLLANVHLRQQNYEALLGDLDAYLKLDPESPAGVRAKELREQVRQKITPNKSEFAAN